MGETEVKKGEAALKAKGSKLQIIIPTAVMMAMILIMMITYMVDLISQSRKTVEAEYVAIAESYATAFEEELEDATTLAGYMASLLMANGSTSIVEEFGNYELALTMLQSLQVNTAAYQAVMANNKGEGMLHDGTLVNLLYESYYSNSSQTEAMTYYVESECITGKSAIVDVIPIIQGELVRGYIYLYFDLQEIPTYYEDETDAEYSFIIVRDKNKVVWNSDNACNKLIAEGTFIDNLKNIELKRMAYHTISNKMGTGNSIKAIAKCDGKEQFIFGVPLSVDKMYLVMTTDADTVARLEYAEWSVVRKMFLGIMISLLAFLLLMLMIMAIRRKEFERKNKELSEKAETDLLTELYNKIATEQKIKQYVATHPNEQALMFILDIDNFKKINDTMGHAFGDEVLKGVGKGLRGEFRYSDIVGRTGGDEFVILLKGLNSDALIQKEAGRLVTFFRNFIVGDYVKYSATASIGAAIFPRDGKTFEDLYKSADAALYKAKRRGKNQLAFYNKDFDDYKGDVPDEDESGDL